MKTKNKMIALMEIAIVLCSLFFMALPAIATEQTTQEANATTITTASEDDYVLDIYGNANEDDTIDMRDLTYVKLIFFGKKSVTELADAKYDGKVNPLDFIQIKLIIVGKEKELTLVDSYDRTVTVNKPVERIIPINCYTVEPLRILNAEDRIVGLSGWAFGGNGARVFFGEELCDLPSIGDWGTDCEVVLSLEPDLVIHYPSSSYDKDAVLLQSADPDLKILCFSYIMCLECDISDEIRKLGYVLDRKDEAEEYIDWYEGIIDDIKARTDELSDDEKPKVFESSKMSDSVWRTGGRDSHYHYCIETAGGISIAADIPGGAHIIVDPEWVLDHNPEIIIKDRYTGMWASYAEDDMTGIIADREEVLSNPLLAEVTAVEEEKVYVLGMDLTWGIRYPLGIAYEAKWFHPTLFEDLDPKAIHQEYLSFQHMDYDLDEHGVFVYPEP